jgi:phosphatidylglycerol:prolipoprotein diacylglycerol transferase
LIPWIIFGIWQLLQGYRSTGRLGFEQTSSLVVWCAVAVALLAGPPLVGAKLPVTSVPVYGYGFMLFIGFTIGGWAAARRARSVGLDGELMWDLALWVFLSGIVGARLFYIVQKRDQVFAGVREPAEFFKRVINLPDGGLVFYGGLILGIAAFFFFCRRRKLNPLLLADLVVPSVFIGLGFGRIGCLLNGCCYGDRCTLPWAIRFPNGSVPFQALLDRGFVDEAAAFSLPLHPSQIYSSLNAFLLAILTATYFKYRHRDGAVLAVAWLAYPVTRFVIEYLRGDELGQFSTSLTISQLVSLGMFLSGAVYVAWLSFRPANTTRRFPAIDKLGKAA